jgi:hypothetical protein
MAAWGSGLKVAGGNYSGQLKSGQYGALGADVVKDYNNSVAFGGFGNDAQAAVGWDNSKQKSKMKEAARLRDEENLQTRGVLDQMKGYDQSYISRIGELDRQMGDQASNASRVYSNDIAPRQKSIMEEAGRQSQDAMSLKDAGDVNNEIHKAVRALYENQAQGVSKQGLADSGVLQAMGAQATANQMGAAGAPLTGSQMQLMAANNQQQAGLAYARAQQEMDRLREQGLERGFSESAAQYGRGQDAINMYQGSIKDYEQGMDNDINRQNMFRNQALGYSGMTHGLQSGGSLRDMGYINQVYGGKQEGINQAIAMANAENAAKSGMVTGLMGAAGSFVGGMYGGPQGAASGGQAGNAVGGGMSGQGQVPQTQGQQQPSAQQRYGYPQSQPQQQQYQYPQYGQQQQQQRYGYYS